jgi:hypothetical protein
LTLFLLGLGVDIFAFESFSLKVLHLQVDSKLPPFIC